MSVEAESPTLDVVIRPMLADEVRLVRSSWLRSYHELAPWNHIPRDVWYSPTGQAGVVDRLLGLADVWVSHEAGTPELALAWCCAGPGRLLHYCYARSTGGLWRRRGLARRLIEHALPGPDPIVCTHWGMAYQSDRPVVHFLRWLKRERAATYNPFA